MFCPNCGSNNPDYMSVCGRCGAALYHQPPANANYPANQQPYQQPNQQPPYGYQQQPNQQPPYGYQQQPNQQPPYGYQQPTYQQQPYGYNPQPCYGNPFQPSIPMKWYKFLIYFLLFFSAFSGVVSAVMYFTGFLYMDPYTLTNISDLVYYRYPGLQALDIFMGIYSIAMAVFAIITRFRLSSYRKDAGMYVFWMYLGGGIVAALYSIISGLMIDDTTSIASAVISLGIQIAIAFCNKTYFDKRKMLFQR